MLTRFYQKKEKLATGILFWILLLSSAFTLLATSLQLYIDYRESKNTLENYLQQIQTSTLPSVSVAVWTLNKKILTSIRSG